MQFNLIVSILILQLFINSSSILLSNTDIKSEVPLSGYIYSEGKPVPYITVVLKDLNKGTFTNDEGYFSLEEIPDGVYILRIQGVGYKPVERNVEIINNQISVLEINMEPDLLMVPQVTVSGRRLGILNHLPGSAGVVLTSEINNINPLSGNEVLRTIAGVHVVEEEGAGLRANIGIRGLDADRSRTVLILEDGVPVALAPYGEPEMYYTPVIDRMAGVEVLKGSGSILYGPQTIGGVINYITPDPPKESQGYANIRGGQHGFFSGLIGYGNTINNAGFQLNYLRKQADNLGPTMFRVNEVTGKAKIDFSHKSTAGLKFGIFDEQSNSTYVGLTQSMYDDGGSDYLRIAPNDNLSIRRYSVSAYHDYDMGDNLSVKTLAYAYTTSRNWRRQDFSGSLPSTNGTGVVHGDESARGGAIYMLNSTGNRNRQFEVVGFEPRLKYRYSLANTTNYLEGGTRLLYERAFEQRVNGQGAEAISGNLRDDEIRTAYAFSMYAQNKMVFSDRFSITPGLRYETMEYERHITRANFNDTSIVAHSNVSEVIPGIGMNYNFTSNIGMFMGIHRGFAPPRTKDAISNSGENLQLEAELSWNMELGARTTFWNALIIELTGFVLDFSNQVIPVSESSGGIGTGLVNGGETRHVGVEASLLADIGALTASKYKLTYSVNATYVDAYFTEDRYILQKSPANQSVEPYYVNVKGNKTPYAPSLNLTSAITFETPGNIGMRLTGNYTGKQYTDVLNTSNVSEWFEIADNDPDFKYVQATSNGRIGEIPSFFLMDASIWYTISKFNTRINLCIKNLLDERYISTRRPQGIRVGLPRLVYAGVNVSF